MTAGSRHPALRIPAEPDALHGMRRWLDQTLSGFGIAQRRREQLVLAVNEACMNIIQHAYGTQAGGEIRLRLDLQSTRLTIELEDDAPAVDPRAIRPRELDDVRPGGLGVHFIREIMDEMEFHPGEHLGNRLRLVKRLDKPGAG